MSGFIPDGRKSGSPVPSKAVADELQRYASKAADVRVRGPGNPHTASCELAYSFSSPGVGASGWGSSGEPIPPNEMRSPKNGARRSSLGPAISRPPSSH